ncbi:histone deacetylase family protein, partial [Salmonella enterica subsp. enterica serovar Enteritidis]|nr:histone deacetylase family protein [Salmonella enterica subsp. enterica serovar Enteritidis]
AFALCRPPGHHAGAAYMGGYCYLNNAAAAAQRFLENARASRISILDVDYHHGNGTQDIFYHRADVQVLSLHGDPSGEYPYFSGFTDETGAREGQGYNFNAPLPPGTDWDAWRNAFDLASQHIDRYGPDVLIVSLGVDTYESDPIGRFLLKSEDFLSLGKRIAGLNRPTLFVMEGG